MKERPILFSGAMVRALLAGTKTQTRREFKARNGGVWPRANDMPGMKQIMRNCPYGQPGDRLWVRETWAYHVLAIGAVVDSDGPFVYRADNKSTQHRLCEKWRPSIHMNRWASRILLEIVSVRVERLNDISEEDARAEGIKQARFPLDYLWNADYPDKGCGSGGGPVDAYKSLWNEINGTGSWAKNPLVWVVEFKCVQGGATC